MEIVPNVMKQCFKLNEHLFDCVSLIYKKQNSSMILWNKYQIFLFENFSAESKTPIAFVPDFLISQLMAVDSYLICLDCAGNIHTISLNFKHSAQKRYKSGFQPRGLGVIAITQYDMDLLLTVKKECESYYLCLHKIKQDLRVFHKEKINFTSNSHKLHEKCILKMQKVSKERLIDLKYIFDSDNLNMNNDNLIVMSLDRITVHACLINSRLTGEEINLVSLYSCPSEICNIQIVEKHEIYLIIALKIGTIIKLVLRDTVVHEIFHLNGYIHCMLALEGSLLHSDGKNMWFTENIFQPDCVKHKQINVKMVNSFIVNDNNIICVTFSNIIYQFSLDDDKMFVSPSSEYYCADKILKKSEHNFKEIERGLNYSKQVAKEADIESNYLLAVALSKRRDLMSNAVQYEAFILDNIDTIYMKEKLLLTSDIQEYFQPYNVNILVRVLMKQHKFNVIFSHLVQDLKLHISLFTDGALIKTITIPLEKITEEMNFVVPLIVSSPKIITVKLNLIPSLPGAFDETQRIWVVVSSKIIVLKYEHLIKSDNMNKSIVHMKNKAPNVNSSLHQLVNKLYKSLLEFQEKQKHNNNLCFYLKLPENYKDILISENSYSKHLDKHKVDFFIRKFSSLNNSHSKLEVSFHVIEEKVKLEIMRDDFVGTVLKISCTNDNISFRMRQFFSKVVYGDHLNSPEAKWIPQAQYAIVEDLQRALRSGSDMNEEKVLSIAEQFQRNVIAALPL